MRHADDGTRNEAGGGHALVISCNASHDVDANLLQLGVVLHVAGQVGLDRRERHVDGV